MKKERKRLRYSAALAHGFLEAAEAFGLHVAREVDGGHIGQLEVELRTGRPAALVGELLEAELVGPDFHVLHGAGVVAHTDHDGAYFAERGTIPWRQ